MEKTDIAIIGAGAIGLAASCLLSDLKKSIIVVEKNPSFGQETSSRNSEVIHAGIYYPKSSLKAKTCIKGRKLLYDFCSKHNIACKKLGKLIVASGADQIAKLNAIFKNALDLGVKGVRFLDKKEIKKMEPQINTESALFSPETGIFDTHGLMQFFYASSKEKNVDFAFSVEAKAIKKEGPFYKITVQDVQGEPFSFQAKVVINSAGLWADKVAEFVGMNPDKYSYKIHYSRGQYFRISAPRKFSVTHLIYPPPSETDLGIHVTPDLGGGLRLGPDARYIDNIDYTFHEEEKGAFLDSVREFLPALKPDDIIPDTAGVRPKLQGAGEAFRDFVIQDEREKGFPGFINLIGIESPGLTSALAIAEMVRDIVKNL